MKSRYIEGFVTGVLSAVLVLILAVAALTVVNNKLIGNTSQQTENTASNTTANTTADSTSINTGAADIYPELAQNVDQVYMLVESGQLVDVGDEDSFRRFSDELTKMMTYIHILYYDEVDDSQLYSNMLHMMMASIGDSYATYYNEEEFAEENEIDNGEYCGIGASVSQNRETMVMTVVEPYINSPAYAAGMRPGDILIAIDGESVIGQYLDDVVKRLRGEAGTQVTVTVTREGYEEPIDIFITRGKIVIDYIDSKMMDDEIGYISISEFSLKTDSQFESALDELLAAGMKGLILDLRDNPGGIVTVAENILNNFTPKDSLLFYIEDKYGNREEYRDKTDKQLDIPIVILVNGNSASASELVTGCLRDVCGATLIGTKTFGKGIIQTTFPMFNGETGVKITTNRYFIPSGVCVHGDGLAPDIELELDDELKQTLAQLRTYDNQIDEAVAQIKLKLQ